MSPSYESLTELDTSRQQGLYILKHGCPRIVQLNGYTVFNIGTLIYENTWKSNALELISRDLNNGKTVQEIASSTRGQFCLIVHDAKDVFIITDRLGTFPIYIFEDKNTIQISNIFLLLARNNNVSVNHQAFAEYLSFDYCFGSTFFNEVKHLKMATIHQFGSKRKTQVYDNVFSNIRFGKYTDLSEVAGTAKETLDSNLSFLGSNDKIFMDITGGFDTRTVTTLLRSMNIDFEAGMCGEQVVGESELAERVAQTLGVKFHSDIGMTDIHLFKLLWNKHFLIGTGVPTLYHSTELIYYYECIKHDFDIHLTGFGGTELTTQDLPKLSFLSSKVNKKGLCRRLLGYTDIFLSTCSTEAQYYNCLTKKIDSLEQEVGSDLHNEVANFMHFSIFNRYYHGCLVGTHNVLMPFYSPFLESNYVKLMMETSYNLKVYHQIQRMILTKLNPTVASLMTSHGYSADFSSKRDISRSRRTKNGVKNLARGMIYEFGLFDAMKRLENMMTKIKSTVNIAEVQRPFWVNEVNQAWSDDMQIFEIIDQRKLNKHLAYGQESSRLKAKILYLNKIIDECKPKL